MPRPFLTARWANLAIITYAVPPETLRAFLPADSGLELDERHDLEELGAPPGHTALVSLVAFEFLSTRVMGIRWPGLINFPEINLRFYVRKGEHRGVMFIKEIVPRRLISAVARRFYDEPYCCAPIEARITQTPNQIEAHYRLSWPGIGTQHIRVRGDKPPVQPDALSLDHWIKEHQWGFTGRPGLAGGAWVYEVIHPVWATYPLIEADIRFDFGSVYGPAWAVLNRARPVSAVFAVGSEVSVFPRQRTLHVRWPVRQQSGDLGNPSPISRGASTGTGGAA